MVRYAPGHMRNLSGKDTLLKYTNLYSMNKTSEIEDGLSAVLGFEFKVNQKNEMKEKLSISMGQVFSAEKNKSMPSRSSLDQRMSDLVGEINYNFSKIGRIDYKFSVDHNYNDLNYKLCMKNSNRGSYKCFWPEANKMEFGNTTATCVSNIKEEAIKECNKKKPNNGIPTHNVSLEDSYPEKFHQYDIN